MKTVFISGSNRGIGKAIATVFAEKGYNIIAHARKKTSSFEIDCDMLSKNYGINVTPILFDMRDVAQMKSAVKEVIFEPKVTIDVLINNAGISDGGLFLMKPVSVIREVFEVNLFSHMELTQLVLKRMPKQGGAIVNVASVAGIIQRRGNSAYGVSKAALIAWTQVLADELLGRVRVNAVAPGLSETDMAANATYKKNIELVNGMRLGKPDEIAKAVFFLSNDEASFINGHTLVIDGGGSQIGGLYSDRT